MLASDSASISIGESETVTIGLLGFESPALRLRSPAMQFHSVVSPMRCRTSMRNANGRSVPRLSIKGFL